MIEQLNWEGAGHYLLWLAGWREARGEGFQGMLGVMCCFRNRIERPSWWGEDYYSVVTKRWQVSSITDPSDKQLTKFPAHGDASAETAMQIAIEVINRTVEHPATGADSYFDTSILNTPRKPSWATPERFVKQIGRLLFYNVDMDHELEIIEKKVWP